MKRVEEYEARHKDCSYPTIDETNSLVIRLVKVTCSTKSNVVDCAMFVMRHMDKFMRVHKPFNCRFSGHGMGKKGKLNMLRKKYAYHILANGYDGLRYRGCLGKDGGVLRSRPRREKKGVLLTCYPGNDDVINI
ncbi:hypothetical protein R6Q57_011158 [Mikania cordata]